MTKNYVSTRLSPLVGPLLVLLVAFSLWFLATRSGGLPSAGRSLPEGNLNDLFGKQVDIVIDRAKLYIGWALALTGAIGFFLKAVIDRDASLQREELVRIETALLLLVVSIIFGEIVISNVLNMLAVVRFDPEDPYIHQYAILQYWSLIAGFAFVGAFIHSFFWRWFCEKSTPSSDADVGTADHPCARPR